MDHMVTCEQILRFVNALCEKYQPRRVVLFGSYADGSPGPDSDVDLMVIMPLRKAGYRQAADMSLRLGSPFPIDLLVRSPEELTHRLSIGDSFLRRIVERGIVLHDARNRRVGEEGRRRLQRRLGAPEVAAVA